MAEEQKFQVGKPWAPHLPPTPPPKDTPHPPDAEQSLRTASPQLLPGAALQLSRNHLLQFFDLACLVRIHHPDLFLIAPSSCAGGAYRPHNERRIWERLLIVRHKQRGIGRCAHAAVPDVGRNPYHLDDIIVGPPPPSPVRAASVTSKGRARSAASGVIQTNFGGSTGERRGVRKLWGLFEGPCFKTASNWQLLI
jgi:hypothetical protein